MISRRIAIVLGSLDLGGAERQGVLIAERLRDDFAATVAVFGMGGGETVMRLCREKGLPCHRLPRIESRFAAVQAAKLVIAAIFLRRWRPDALLPFTDPANRLCTLLRRLIGARAAVWNQRDAGLDRGPHALERLAVRRATRVVANGPEPALFAHRSLGFPDRRIVLIANAVEAPRPQADRPSWRARLEVAPTEMLATAVANLHRNKDHPTLLRAWAAALPRLGGAQRAHLVLAGRDDGAGPALRDLARDLGIADAVSFLGAVDDIAGLLAASGMLVHSSRSEGCPNAVLEAMAAGLPVVGTDIAAMRAVLPDVQHALLADPGDVDALAERIVRVAREPSLSAACAAANRLQASRFALAAAADAFARVLRLSKPDAKATGTRAPSTVDGPRLAFLIPSKNRHGSLLRTLPRCERAAARVGAEVLVCDQSAQPCAAMPGVRVLHRPDLNGLPAARNVLLAATDAEVVCFLDDDLDIADDFAERLLAHARAEPDVVGWGPVVELRPRRVRRLHRLVHLGAFRDPRRLLGRRCDRPTGALFGCCFAVRRLAANAVRFDASHPGYALGEDLDFFLRLSSPLRFCADLRAIHRKDGHDRADPLQRGRQKGDFLVWLARRHGIGNPATLLHAALAIAAAASGRGEEPASAWSVLGRALAW